MTASDWKDPSKYQWTLFFIHSRVVLTTMTSMSISWDIFVEISDSRIYNIDWFVPSFKWRIRFWNEGYQSSWKQDSVSSLPSPKYKVTLLNPSWGSPQTINTAFASLQLSTQRAILIWRLYITYENNPPSLFIC